MMRTRVDEYNPKRGPRQTKDGTLLFVGALVAVLFAVSHPILAVVGLIAAGIVGIVCRE